eukprot:3252129-Rhodomonas_salina.1
MGVASRDGDDLEATVKKLLDAGADKSLKDEDGDTALMFAKNNVQDEAKRAELVKLLADTSTLLGAAVAGDTEAIARLIEAQCYVDEQDVRPQRERARLSLWV